MGLVYDDLSQKCPDGPHRLVLEERQHMSLTGVTDVDSFDDTVIVLRTNRGLLTVRGEGLQLKSLNVEGGQVSVDGTVSVLVYEAAPREGGFFRRLLG